MKKEYQEYRSPSFYGVYINSFGDRTQVELDLDDETLDALAIGFRKFSLAVGFSEKTVQEVLPTEFDLMNREEESHNLEKYYDGETSDHMTSDDNGSNDREF